MQAARKHTMGFVPLIEVNRGGLVECQHWGAVAVADRDGRVSAQVGDPYTVTFTRSTIKAFQAQAGLTPDGHPSMEVLSRLRQR